jgi:hypothetical protein
VQLKSREHFPLGLQCRPFLRSPLPAALVAHASLTVFSVLLSLCFSNPRRRNGNVGPDCNLNRTPSMYGPSVLLQYARTYGTRFFLHFGLYVPHAFLNVEPANNSPLDIAQPTKSVSYWCPASLSPLSSTPPLPCIRRRARGSYQYSTSHVRNIHRTS